MATLLSTVPPTLAPTATATQQPTIPPTPEGAPAAPTQPAAANPFWTSMLLAGPGEPGRLYAGQTDADPWYSSTGPPSGTATRILVSDDDAQTWQPFAGSPARLAGMDYASGAPYGVTGDGLARWTGQAWQTISSEPVWKLAVAYGDPQSLWATGPTGVIHSADGGATWQPGGGYSGYANDIAIDPSGSGYLFSVFVVKGWWGHLARSTGNGQWTALPFPDGTTTTTNIQGIAVDGATGDIYLAFGSRHSAGSPFGGQIWRTANPDALRVEDVRWELVHDFGPDAEIMLLASGWSPQPGRLALYANVRPALQCDPVTGLCDPPSPWMLHRSQDGGHTWQPLPMP